MKKAAKSCDLSARHSKRHIADKFNHCFFPLIVVSSKAGAVDTDMQPARPGLMGETATGYGRCLICGDRGFPTQRIPHHEGAVQMSENTLNFCICQSLRPILRNIITTITTQEQEIVEMEQLLMGME